MDITKKENMTPDKYKEFYEKAMKEAEEAWDKLTPEEKAKADLLEIAYHYGIETREDLEEKWPGIFEEHWGDLVCHLDGDTGLDAIFVKRFAEEICDDESEAYYQLSEAGKTETGILDLYLNAFALAYEQVK